MELKSERPKTGDEIRKNLRIEDPPFHGKATEADYDIHCWIWELQVAAPQC